MVMAEYTLFFSPIPVLRYTGPYLHHCLVGVFVGLSVGCGGPYRGEWTYYKVGYT